MKKAVLGLMICTGIAALVVFSSPAFAAVSGPCANCHTMHNSQDGAAMGEATPQPHLTMSGCLGCHTGTGVGGAPVINGAYNVASTAGGTFLESGGAGEFVADDTCAHNVDIILTGLGEDDNFSSIPGLSGGMNSGKGSSTFSDLTCAGSDGCHGDATVAGNDAGIGGFHHGSKDGWRYLQIASDQSAVLGKGAADWEKAMSDGWTSGDEHNVYSSSTTVGINKFCANCHPNFHGTANTQSGSTWVRHPTDNNISGGWAAVVDYRDNPFAFADISGLEPDGTYDDTSAQVACISCHRAHGTPYSDILRWQYSTQIAGGGYVAGCLGCHTAQQ